METCIGDVPHIDRFGLAGIRNTWLRNIPSAGSKHVSNDSGNEEVRIETIRPQVQRRHSKLHSIMFFPTVQLLPDATLFSFHM